MSSAEDGALSSAEDIMTRAREIASSLTGGLATPEARQTAAEEVTELERGLLSLGNTTVAGRYVFGGLTTSGPVFKSLDDPTFAPNTAYTGPTATFSVQVGPNESARVTSNGGNVFNSSIQALDDLRQTLLAGDPPTANLTPLQNAAEDLRQEDASVGGRMARLQSRHTEIGNAVLTSKTVLSGVEDADLTESITQLAQLQNALQATLTAGQSILQTSIVNYIRL
jgi:flagellar hook-associated protein 3 FlgL